MDTDEYAISLSRELDVCTSYIREIERLLSRMEKKHDRKTEQAIADFRGGRVADQDGDFAAWAKAYESLEGWKRRRGEYEALVRAMRG